MIIKTEQDGTIHYYTETRKELAVFYPKFKGRWRKADDGTKILMAKPHPAELSFNSNRLDEKFEKKSYVDRALPEFKEEIREICLKHRGVRRTEHLYA